MEDLRAPLLQWFDQHARLFPWREDRTPYRVWISEIMLQQTRAATVVPYFLRWMRRFPNLEALAEAAEQEVLAQWEGMGYYRRAHALHAAARHLVATNGGRLPVAEQDWLALPGVGPYTAAAIAALAYEQPVIAVDANVRRVGARLLADPMPDHRHLRRALHPLLPPTQPGRASEALIELGATVCTPGRPNCPVCPLVAGCQAARAGRQHDYPAATVRRKPPALDRWAVVRLSAGRVWLERRPAGDLLGGLWGFPQRNTAPAGEPLSPLVQRYTHLRLRLTPVIVRDHDRAPYDREPSSTGAPPPQAHAEARWLSVGDLAELPLSKVDRRLLALLRDAGLLASPP